MVEGAGENHPAQVGGRQLKCSCSTTGYIDCLHVCVHDDTDDSHYYSHVCVINGSFHHTWEIRFSKFAADYVIRNAPYEVRISGWKEGGNPQRWIQYDRPLYRWKQSIMLFISHQVIHFNGKKNRPWVIKKSCRQCCALSTCTRVFVLLHANYRCSVLLHAGVS